MSKELRGSSKRISAFLAYRALASAILAFWPPDTFGDFYSMYVMSPF